MGIICLKEYKIVIKILRIPFQRVVIWHVCGSMLRVNLNKCIAGLPPSFHYTPEIIITSALYPLPKALAKSELYGSPGWALYLLVGPGGAGLWG